MTKATRTLTPIFAVCLFALLGTNSASALDYRPTLVCSQMHLENNVPICIQIKLTCPFGGRIVGQVNPVCRTEAVTRLD